ncbi:breast cancer type 1 susceptibility protein homolog [Macadamia integrifolia]|uniref:breast cancer type 1 susceptibility protein homolog n=1 Tax=Macadamia integrifolia TaxID=60698 RepID=UPI001C4E42A2|nr:breast cancer type 1 susceptibility protein homolog [Macadamia integrifolia]
MGDARDDFMDIDSNLGLSVPLSPNSDPDLGPLLAEWRNIEERIRHLEAVTVRARNWCRWRQGRLLPETRYIPVEMISSSRSLTGLQTGEGSVAVEDRTIAESNQVRKGKASDLVAKALGLCKDAKKGTASFFECNICLDVARNPVLTCCGHLFCWPCLYQWLHIDSDAKECPVCEGEVTYMNITPIYNGGNDNQESGKEDESGVKVPPRPHARAADSLRQWINWADQIEDSYLAQIIRQIGNRFDVMGECTPPQDIDVVDKMRDRSNSLDQNTTTNSTSDFDYLTTNSIENFNFPATTSDSYSDSSSSSSSSSSSVSSSDSSSDYSSSDSSSDSGNCSSPATTAGSNIASATFYFW